MSIFGDAKPRDASNFTQEKRQARKEDERRKEAEIQRLKEEEEKRIARTDLRLKRCAQTMSRMDFKMSNIMKIIESTKHGITRVQLLKKIMEQVEFYFSDDNLATDVFLLKQMYTKNNEEHWVPLKVIATFQKIKAMCGAPNSKKQAKLGKQTLAASIQFSSLLVLDGTKSRVRRTTKLTGFNVYQILSRSVVVRKLSPSMITAQAVRSKILEKCRGSSDCKWVASAGSSSSSSSSSTTGDATSTESPPIERILFVSGKEQPQDVLRVAYKTNENNSGDDVRGVDARRDRGACVIVVAQSCSIACDLVRNMDEPNNWRGGMRVEMMSGEKVHSVQQQQQQQQQKSFTSYNSRFSGNTIGEKKERGKTALSEMTQGENQTNSNFQEVQVLVEEEKLKRIAKRKEQNRQRQIEMEKKDELSMYEDNEEVHNATGVVLVCKNSDRYGFVGRSILQRKGTYFKFQEVKTSTEDGETAPADGVDNTIRLRRGDHVSYNIVRDRKTQKLKATNIVPLGGENAVDVAKREKKEMLAAKALARAEVRNEAMTAADAARATNNGTGFSRRRFADEAESNLERKKYLRERKLKSMASKTSGRVQKSGNNRNQFGENVDSPTNSGVLLDILGRDTSCMEKSNGGKDGSGPTTWKIKTAKGPDSTRGFDSVYQKSRGRLERSLSCDAVEFVPPNSYE